MIDGMAVWFGVLGGLAAAGQVAGVVMKRLKRAKATHAVHRAQARDASARLRDLARETLALRREERAMRRDIADLTEGVAEEEAALARERAAESPLHMLEERHSPGDRPFEVAVSHPDFAAQFYQAARQGAEEVTASWQAGRRYLVWGVNDKAAQAKAALRFPADKGYAVGAAALFEGDLDGG